MTEHIDLTDVVIAIADNPNKNDRIYSTECLQQIVDQYETIYGQIGIPIQFELDPTRVSHKVINLRLIDNILMGDVIILPTSGGADLNKMLDAGPIEFQTAGMVTTNEDGIITDYKLTSINAVSDGA